MRKVYADVMLAKLARWLRLAGIKIYDTPYKDDARLLRFIKTKGSILLTADEQLFLRAKKLKAKAFLVSESGVEKQIAFVASSLKARIKKGPTGICPICNSKLVRISRRKAKKLVPPNAYSHYRTFYFCKRDKKAYWSGTHWKRIRSALERAAVLQSKMRKSNE